jgi:hypothetical protein
MRETIKNKVLALFLIGIGALLVHIEGDATVLVFCLIFGIPMFFAKGDLFYHIRPKHECRTCSKYGTLMCPNSIYCYSAPDKPYWKNDRVRTRNKCYNDNKILKGSHNHDKI